MRAQPRRWIRREEAGNPLDDRVEVGAHIGKPRKVVHQVKGWFLFDARPKLTKAVEAVFRRIARDQRRVDRAYRRSDHPIGLDAGLVQGLVDADLIGTERTAALQHQDDMTRKRGSFTVARASSRSRFSTAWYCHCSLRFRYVPGGTGVVSSSHCLSVGVATGDRPAVPLGQHRARAENAGPGSNGPIEELAHRHDHRDGDRLMVGLVRTKVRNLQLAEGDSRLAPSGNDCDRRGSGAAAWRVEGCKEGSGTATNRVIVYRARTVLRRCP